MYNEWNWKSNECIMNENDNCVDDIEKLINK
jgi:hypothetical protein